MKGWRVVVIFICTLFLSSCAGKQQAAVTPPQENYPGVSRIDGASLETVQQEARLTTGYQNIILNPIQMEASLGTDYPAIPNQFQISMFSHLKDKNIYKSVTLHNADNQLVKADTLLIDVKVIDMRIVSSGARIWAGAFAGASYMDIHLTLTDAVNKKVVHEKIITTRNNAFASSWAIGSEQSLPMDMGKIVGEYISAVVPAS